MSPAALEKAVGLLPKTDDPSLLWGMETSDDAGVYQLSDEIAVVNSVDYFTPIVDDPRMFGEIAAANALSDIYAMGAVPQTALNIVYWNKNLPIEILSEILLGGSLQLERAGCALVGGHSVEASELMYGMAVTGSVHPKRFKRNRGARAGDILILTKPLGVGVLTTAAKFNMITEAELQPAIDSMRQLNDAAGFVLQEYEGRAATDVTGYGLAGHGYEMASASEAALEFDAERLPVLPLALELIRKGVKTRAPKTNAAYIGKNLKTARGVSKAARQLFLEAETSGGLLIAFPPDRAAAALEALHERGCVYAAEVGRVVEAPASGVSLLA